MGKTCDISFTVISYILIRKRQCFIQNNISHFYVSANTTEVETRILSGKNVIEDEYKFVVSMLKP